MWNSKPKRHRCDCRGRSHNNPKVGDGICRDWGYRPAVVERIAGKRLARAWFDAARVDALEDSEM